MRSFIRFCNYARIFATLETLVCPQFQKMAEIPAGYAIKSRAAGVMPLVRVP